MRRHMYGSVVAAIAVTLTVAPSALTRAGDRTLAETYPVATALCAKAHQSTLPTRLETKRAAVLTACDTLETAFAPLGVTVSADEAQCLSIFATQKSLVAAACARPVKDTAPCESARATARSTDATA